MSAPCWYREHSWTSSCHVKLRQPSLCPANLWMASCLWHSLQHASWLLAESRRKTSEPTAGSTVGRLQSIPAEAHEHLKGCITAYGATMIPIPSLQRGRPAPQGPAATFLDSATPMPQGACLHHCFQRKCNAPRSCSSLPAHRHSAPMKVTSKTPELRPILRKVMCQRPALNREQHPVVLTFV